MIEHGESENYDTNHKELSLRLQELVYKFRSYSMRTFKLQEIKSFMGNPKIILTRPRDLPLGS